MASNSQSIQNQLQASLSVSMESVIENTPLLAIKKLPKKPERVYSNKELIGDDQEFATFVQNMENVFREGLYPIPDQNSIGVYNVQNRSKQIIGVFRPKDEEFEALQAKRFKDFIVCSQKRKIPHPFLVRKNRYLSEVGTSIIDRKLGLNIVPNTRVVALSCETFEYTVGDRMRVRAKQIIDRFLQIFGRHVEQTKLPAKIGSLKCYANGFSEIDTFVEASHFFRLYKTCVKSEKFVNKLQFEFEKYVVLNYLTRNTKTTENDWRIKLDDSLAQKIGVKSGSIKSKAMSAKPRMQSVERRATDPTVGGQTVAEAVVTNRKIEISPKLIDSKIVYQFPTEPPQEPQQETRESEIVAIEQSKTGPSNRVTIDHPLHQPSTSSANQSETSKAIQIVAMNVSEGFPIRLKQSGVTYWWANNELARNPFTNEIKYLVLGKLTNWNIINEMFAEIKREFERDVDYNALLFYDQVCIMRGQIQNLMDALLENKTPFELSTMNFNYMYENYFVSYINKMTTKYYSLPRVSP